MRRVAMVGEVPKGYVTLIIEGGGRTAPATTTTPHGPARSVVAPPFRHRSGATIAATAKRS